MGCVASRVMGKGPKMQEATPGKPLLTPLELLKCNDDADKVAAPITSEGSVAIEPIGDCAKTLERALLIGTLGTFSVAGLYCVNPRECVVQLHNGRVTSLTSTTGLHWAPAVFRSSLTHSLHRRCSIRDKRDQGR